MKKPFWRRRSYQAMGIVLAILIVAAFATNFLLACQYDPGNAVSQYLSAIENRDAAGVWGVTQMGAPAATAAITLTDRPALQAALASGRSDISAFSVDGTRYPDADGASAVVDVTYQTSIGSRQTEFNLVRTAEERFGIYPVWRVEIQPAMLYFQAAASAGTVSVDGRPLSLGTGTSAIAVWPVAHRITFGGTALIEPRAESVDSFKATTVTVASQPKLTQAGVAQVIAAVKASFASCAAQTNLHPDACPQRYDDSYTNSGSWQLVGDPTQGLIVAFDKDQNLTASGHFAMVAAYQSWSLGTVHAPSAGGYVADLALTSNDVIVTSIKSADGVAGLSRPDAATDQAAKDVVKKAIGACVGARSDAAADCPQQYFFPTASNFHWTLSGDPTKSATVTFDPSTGIFDVHGSLPMTATYDMAGHSESSPSSTTSYDALLLWDGSALQLVTISGGYS